MALAVQGVAWATHEEDPHCGKDWVTITVQAVKTEYIRDSVWQTLVVRKSNISALVANWHDGKMPDSGLITFEDTDTHYWILIDDMFKVAHCLD